MVEYEETVVYKDGVGHVVARPKTTIKYRNGIGERVPEMDETIRYKQGVGERVPVEPQPIRLGRGVTIDAAIQSAMDSRHPEERALLPQLLEMRDKEKRH
ncbi:MAG: hypothetical protein PHF67_02365 [Candidatus Nanoarchaeia archaeon]|nr:hypothetical protein [Candidatus Nanoarchaeia archaeon]